MAERLVFPDRQAAADVMTFARRSARVGDAGLRLQANAGMLAMSTAALAPRGLLDATPTILGLRAVSVDPELQCDLAVDASALTLDAGDPCAILLPDRAISAPWTGIAPPRSGWERIGQLSSSVLAARGQLGISAVAAQLPAGAGEDVVRIVRAGVWSVPDPELAELPQGVAFAALTLGFIVGDEAVALFRAQAWTRLGFARGHVLVRRPARSGLTPVRMTGARPPR